MSEEFVNTWKPRKPIILRCPKGSMCEVRKPGPELALKTASLQRRLRALRAASTGDTEIPKALEEMTEEEQIETGLRVVAEMTEEFKELNLELMRIVVVACVTRPKLYRHPKPGELGVEDIEEEDFYFIYNWWAAGCKDPDEEVTAADADRFPVEQESGVGVGDNGSDVRAEAECVAQV